MRGPGAAVTTFGGSPLVSGKDWEGPQHGAWIRRIEVSYRKGIEGMTFLMLALSPLYSVFSPLAPEINGSKDGGEIDLKVLSLKADI